MIGLEAKPSERELIILLKFMKKNMKLYSLEEVELAFETMVMNKIEKVEPYGKFSPSFLQDVMDNYRVYRDSLINKENRKQLEPQKPKTISDKESYDFIVDFIKRKNEIPIGANWSQAYNYMEGDMLNLTKEQKDIIRAEVVEKRGRLKDEEMKYYCKREAVIQHFEIMHNLTRHNLTV